MNKSESIFFPEIKVLPFRNKPFVLASSGHNYTVMRQRSNSIIIH